MWAKVKNYLIIAGSAVAVVVLSIICVLMCGSKADRRGSDGTDERDRAIKEGIGECEERAGRVEERLERAGESVDRCEEHLRRAEEILREAIRRSKEEDQKADNNSVSD